MSDAGGVGLVGHRSFISRALIAELDRRGLRPAVLSKGLLGGEEVGDLDLLYLVTGRERPTEEEAAVELAQVRALTRNPRRPSRIVFLSSRLELPHKRACEALVRDAHGVSVRPPAIFGPGQRPDSAMLIPSLVRTAGGIPLREPDRPSMFIHVDRLAVYLADLADPHAYWSCAEWDPASLDEIPGCLTLTPAQVRDLFLTFQGLSRPQGTSRGAQDACGAGNEFPE